MKRSFRFKLFTLFLISSIFPMLAMGTLASAYFSNQNSRVSEQNIVNTLYTVSENISIYLDDLKRVSISPNVYPDVMKYFRYLNTAQEEVSYENYLLGYNYRSLMQRLLTLSRQDIRGVAFIPRNNPDQVIYCIDTRLGINSQQRDYDYRSSKWYGEALASEGTPVFTASYSQEYYSTSHLGLQPAADQEGLFSVTRVVYNDNARAVLGVIKVDASDTVIRNIFRNISTSANSGLLLLDNHGDLIWASNRELDSLAPRIRPGESTLQSGVDSYSVYTQPIENAGWQLIYLDSARDAGNQIRGIFLFSTAIALCCVLVGFVIFTNYSRRMTKPVIRIVETMKQVEGGNLQARSVLPDYANQEFTVISDELNHMILQLETLINSEYKAVISQRNAEFLALQTQINPHFFYNTLNGLITLNRLEDKKKLEESILQLTALFRYTCNNRDQATVADELHFLKMYLALQQLRFEDRLQYRIELTEAARQVVIPRLLVQPLVENAVIHGMEPSDKAFLLEVDAFVEPHPVLGRLLVLSVADSGVGFDLRQSPVEKRVGLQSVAERLELFHSGGVFVIKSRLGEGTHSVILLPLDTIAVDPLHRKESTSP